ncbi:UNVERIFIED_CONTAM: hypothetical protein Cloal_0503 [Acetivibrio alkalicellulosi]
MIGIGTIVNAVGIILGTVVGILLKNGLPQRFKNIIMQSIGLAVFVVGLSGTLQGIYKVTINEALDRQYIMLMIISLVIGGILGELLDIEMKLEKIGNWFQNKFASKDNKFSEGFVTASLVYCIGAMAIVGSFEDGLARNPDTLFAKSILDGVLSVILAASYGIGVGLSAVPVFLYQGGLTLMSGMLEPILTDIVVTQMSLVGSVLIMAIGINILEIKKIKVGNLLPSMFIPVCYYTITIFV